MPHRRFTHRSGRARVLAWAAAAAMLIMPGLPCAAAEAASGDVLASNTPSRTPAGATFTAPAGWALRTAASHVAVAAPEGDASIAIFDTTAPNAEGALAEAWRIFRPQGTRPVKVTTPQASRNGWE